MGKIYKNHAEQQTNTTYEPIFVVRWLRRGRDVVATWLRRGCDVGLCDRCHVAMADRERPATATSHLH